MNQPQADRTGRGRISPVLKQSSDVIAERGEGAYIHGRDGRRYLDFTSGIGVTATGHCHPRVVEAAKKQVETLVHGQYAIVRHPPMLELSERLADRMPGAIDSIFFSNAGTEACETAMRLARQATGRPKIIVFQGGFHGRTMGSLSMTSSSVGLRAGVEPMMAGTVFAPFPNHYRYGWSEDEATDFALRELDYLLATQAHPCETGALFIEPIQGEAGYVPAGRRFMKGLRERADHHNMLLIADEVQCGYGRSGAFWAHSHYDVEPDVIVSAKGLASGFPLSAVGAPESVMARAWPASQGGTYGGNAVACAAALATLDVFEEEGLVDNAKTVGRHLRERLDHIAAEHGCVANVRGMGLMHGTEIVDAEGNPDGERAAQLLKAMEARDVLMIRCGPQGQIVRWLPPLIISRDEAERATEAFVDAIRATARPGEE